LQQDIAICVPKKLSLFFKALKTKAEGCVNPSAFFRELRLGGD